MGKHFNYIYIRHPVLKGVALIWITTPLWINALSLRGTHFR